MKYKILFLFSALLATGIAANAGKCGDPTNCKKINKRNDINGIVLQGVSKKPIKEVSVTAYSTVKKEKVVVTDMDGSYYFDDLKPGVYKFVFEKEGYYKVVKEKVSVRTDEAFQLNIEMIEASDNEIMPSPFHF
ncbi:MAG: carboxypeptidase regulatory-like domain-containing protein [Bacteroidetes bacterium]|nr:carboxypeptidase regulatory-like domain-containing protein [Bacteroidota bacterium]